MFELHDFINKIKDIMLKGYKERISFAVEEKYAPRIIEKIEEIFNIKLVGNEEYKQCLIYMVFKYEELDITINEILLITSQKEDNLYNFKFSRMAITYPLEI